MPLVRERCPVMRGRSSPSRKPRSLSSAPASPPEPGRENRNRFAPLESPGTTIPGIRTPGISAPGISTPGAAAPGASTLNKNSWRIISWSLNPWNISPWNINPWNFSARSLNPRNFVPRRSSSPRSPGGAAFPCRDPGGALGAAPGAEQRERPGPRPPQFPRRSLEERNPGNSEGRARRGGNCGSGGSKGSSRGSGRRIPGVAGEEDRPPRGTIPRKNRIPGVSGRGDPSPGDTIPRKGRRIPGASGGGDPSQEKQEQISFPGDPHPRKGFPRKGNSGSLRKRRPLPGRSPSQEKQEQEEQSPAPGSLPQFPLERDSPRRIQVLARPKIPRGASGMSPKVLGRSRELPADPKIQLLEPIPGCCSRL